MAEFINTVETLGDAVLTDSIIDRSVTEYRDNTVEIIGPYAFSGCGALTTVDCPGIKEIGAYAFRGCTALAALILRGEIPQALGTDAFTDSGIAAGTGYVYVPASLYESYMLVANGSPLAAQLRKLEEWTDDGTVDGALALDGKHAVRFFNSDGTFLGYAIVADGGDAVYPGEDPVYPEDPSWTFSGFSPEPTGVTADMDCVAQYSMPVSFANSSWEDIVRIAESGDAKNHFSLGDTREFEYTAPDGTTKNATLRIVGFDHDNLADGSGKAAISIMAVYTDYWDKLNTTADYSTGWVGCQLRTSLNGAVFNSFPEALRNGIKSVTKISRIYVDGTSTAGTCSSNDKVWLPSLGELGITATVSNWGYAGEADQAYAGRPSASAGIDVEQNSNGNKSYWFRSGGYAMKSKAGFYQLACTSTSNYRAGTENVTYTKGIIIGFCI